MVLSKNWIFKHYESTLHVSNDFWVVWNNQQQPEEERMDFRLPQCDWITVHLLEEVSYVNWIVGHVQYFKVVILLNKPQTAPQKSSDLSQYVVSKIVQVGNVLLTINVASCADC